LVSDNEKIREQLRKNPIFVRYYENKTDDDNVEQYHCGTLFEVE